jgi:hypothetical protein
MSVFSILASIIKPVGDIIDDVTTTDEERLAAKAKLAEVTKDIEMKMIDYASTLAESRTQVILAEAQGTWLQRNWRPILMLIAIIIIANNYILFPYISAFTDKVKVLELPGGLWTLLTTGVTGYVVGRSGEKIAKTMKNGS